MRTWSSRTRSTQTQIRSRFIGGDTRQICHFLWRFVDSLRQIDSLRQTPCVAG